MHAQTVADAFGLGRATSLSDPVARGELGEICRLETAPLAEADEWLTPYREFFEARIPGLERQLANERRQEER